MADIHTARLCLHIINSHFGPLTAKVADVLLTRGRLSLSQIVRQTSLKPRTVRAAILVLIQHGSLWHAFTDEDGEVLEFNIEGCLMRLRFGRFIFLSEQLYGKFAGEIVQHILDHGKLRAPEIMSHLVTKENAANLSEYKKALLKLVKSKHLVAATESSHVSPRDTILKYEKEEIAKISGLPTSKELKMAKEDAAARVKREEEEAGTVGLKRKGGNDLVDEKVLFRVNHDRFSIHIRNELLQKAAQERFNVGAATVLRAVLKTTEATQTSLSQTRSDATSVAKVATMLADEDGLADGLQINSKNASNATCVKHYLGMLSSSDNPTPAGRKSSFVSYTSSKVEVEFEIACRRLRRRVLESFTRERYGNEGVRILRLLFESGKLDEKQITKIVLLPAKDVRPLLTSMASDSIVSIQEVPRSADRNPTRTFYLWYVDQAKAYSVILGNLYKTLYNINARRSAEEEQPTLKAVLEKTQRSDVSQNESLLSRLDHEFLDAWAERQAKLTILEMRVEESVFVIRDLGVLGVDDE